MSTQGIATASGADQILVAAKAGDQASFEQLIEPHIAAGYRLAVSMLNDASQAEDVLQEATFRAWRAIGQLGSVARLKPWFLTIVANRSRSLRSTRWWSVIPLPHSSSVVGTATDVSDAHADLISALYRLTADERAAVFLRFYEDMNSDQIGDVLGISATAARSRIHRALKRLRVELAEDEKL